MHFSILHKASQQSADDIASIIKTDVDEDCRDYTMQLNKLVGEGIIRMIDFKDVVSLFAIDASFAQATTLEFLDEANDLLRFNYCLEGQVFHKLYDENVLASLTKHKGSVTANQSGTQQVMVFPAKERVRFLSIELDRKHYQKKLPCDIDKIPEKLLDVLEDCRAAQVFLYQHNYAHVIHEEALEILDTSYVGLVKTTHQESKALEIIAQQFKQFTDDISTEKPKKILKEFELEKIGEVRTIIREEMKNPPSIPELAKRVGLNQQKLKKGFKQIYDRSIRNYIVKLRMEHARALLLSGQFSVKEVAYQVGYENKSYFARKFREYFEVLPSDLLKQEIK